MKRILFLLLCGLPLMADSATFYPASADDGTVAPSSGSTMPTSAAPSDWAATSIYDTVGFTETGWYSVSETLLRFDTSSMAGKSIQSATLTLTVFQLPSPYTTGCHFSAGWWSGPADYTFWTRDDVQDAFAEIGVGAVFTTAPQTVNLSLINLGSINKTGYTGIRLRLQESSCSLTNENLTLVSVRNPYIPYRPYLTITYVNSGAKLIIVGDQ
ncbi:MAG: hypothetical protein M1541_14800 [Acidobacteria bacterium]|nr:hypothetical protein [Acidobacteriota bacterium]